MTASVLGVVVFATPVEAVPRLIQIVLPEETESNSEILHVGA